VKILAIAAIAALGPLSGPVLAQTSDASQLEPTPIQAQAQAAGLCVKLDDMGEVVDARIAQTSGDPALDQNAVALAHQLQWSPPYPKAGWLGVRITLSPSPEPATPGAVPHCSAASDDSVASAI
jgi:TonB family protein